MAIPYRFYGSLLTVGALIPLSYYSLPAVSRLMRALTGHARGDDPGRRPGLGSGRRGRRSRAPDIGRTGLPGGKPSSGEPPALVPIGLIVFLTSLAYWNLFSASPWSRPCWPTSRWSPWRSG